MRQLFGWIFIVVVASLTACGGASNRDQLAASQVPATQGVLFTSAPSSITLSIGGDVSNYTIGGGTRPYTARAADERVATGRVSGTTLTITPLAAGATQILVSDAAGGQVLIGVTVAGNNPAALHIAAPSSVTVPAGVVPATYVIVGGSPAYIVQSSNTAVATATVAGSLLSINALTVGSATVTVFDATGAQASLTVAVSSSTGAALTVSPNGATGSVGDVLTFVLRGGSPAYTVTSTNANIASLSSNTVATSGASFTATLRDVGDTVITVSDAQNQVQSFTITSGTTSPQLRISPSTFLIGENDVSQIAVKIFGGTAPYTAFTSDTLKATVAVVGSVLNITPGSSGTRCINPVTDATPPVYVVSGTYNVTITVIDSLGATGTSVMTIKDNGAGLNLGCP